MAEARPTADDADKGATLAHLGHELVYPRIGLSLIDVTAIDLPVQLHPMSLRLRLQIMFDPVLSRQTVLSRQQTECGANLTKHLLVVDNGVIEIDAYAEHCGLP